MQFIDAFLSAAKSSLASCAVSIQNVTASTSATFSSTSSLPTPSSSTSSPAAAMHSSSPLSSLEAPTLIVSSTSTTPTLCSTPSSPLTGPSSTTASASLPKKKARHALLKQLPLSSSSRFNSLASFSSSSSASTSNNSSGGSTKSTSTKSAAKSRPKRNKMLERVKDGLREKTLRRRRSISLSVPTRPSIGGAPPTPTPSPASSPRMTVVGLPQVEDSLMDEQMLFPCDITDVDGSGGADMDGDFVMLPPSLEGCGPTTGENASTAPGSSGHVLPLAPGGRRRCGSIVISCPKPVRASQRRPLPTPPSPSTTPSSHAPASVLHSSMDANSDGEGDGGWIDPAVHLSSPPSSSSSTPLPFTLFDPPTPPAFHSFVRHQADVYHTLLNLSSTSVAGAYGDWLTSPSAFGSSPSSRDSGGVAHERLEEGNGSDVSRRKQDLGAAFKSAEKQLIARLYFWLVLRGAKLWVLPLYGPKSRVGGAAAAAAAPPDAMLVDSQQSASTTTKSELDEKPQLIGDGPFPSFSHLSAYLLHVRHLPRKREKGTVPRSAVRNLGEDGDGLGSASGRWTKWKPVVGSPLRMCVVPRPVRSGAWWNGGRAKREIGGRVGCVGKGREVEEGEICELAGTGSTVGETGGGPAGGGVGGEQGEGEDWLSGLEIERSFDSSLGSINSESMESEEDIDPFVSSFGSESSYESRDTSVSGCGSFFEDGDPFVRSFGASESAAPHFKHDSEGVYPVLKEEGEEEEEMDESDREWARLRFEMALHDLGASPLGSGRAEEGGMVALGGGWSMGEGNGSGWCGAGDGTRAGLELDCERPGSPTPDSHSRLGAPRSWRHDEEGEGACRGDLSTDQAQDQYDLHAYDRPENGREQDVPDLPSSAFLAVELEALQHVNDKRPLDESSDLLGGHHHDQHDQHQQQQVEPRPKRRRLSESEPSSSLVLGSLLLGVVMEEQDGQASGSLQERSAGDTQSKEHTIRVVPQEVKSGAGDASVTLNDKEPNSDRTCPRKTGKPSAARGMKARGRSGSVGSAAVV